MTSTIIANLEKLLNGPRDGALLRFSLGNEWLKAGDTENAIRYLREATARDATFSAAWKALGRALADNGNLSAALEAYATGIAVAESRGDLQAAKEMTVFAKRVQKQIESK